MTIRVQSLHDSLPMPPVLGASPHGERDGQQKPVGRYGQSTIVKTQRPSRAGARVPELSCSVPREEGPDR